MTELEALVGLNLVLDIGSVRLKNLLEIFDKPQDILNAPVEKLTLACGIADRIACKIRGLSFESIDREFETARRNNISILDQSSPDYPKNLRNITDPPIILYVKGRIKEEDCLSIAIVGSRKATFYGLSHAEKFGYELSSEGFTVVSGMARGIDTSAHKGALKADGRTIAVIGSGFNRIYPRENKELSEEIAKKGAVISEFPFDTEPLKQNFPRRNRLISGMSLGVLVVEACRNSGALITADFALEQGRDVFALPGQINSPASFGANQLIKQGAKLVSETQDITQEYGFSQKEEQDIRNLSENNGRADKLSEDEAMIYGIIADQELFFDDILEESDIEAGQLSDILLRLQLKSMIRQFPGRRFKAFMHLQ